MAKPGLGEDRDDRTAASQTRKAPPAPASSTRIDFRAGEETRQTGIKHLGTIEGDVKMFGHQLPPLVIQYFRGLRFLLLAQSQ